MAENKPDAVALAVEREIRFAPVWYDYAEIISRHYEPVVAALRAGLSQIGRVGKTLNKHSSEKCPKCMALEALDKLEGKEKG